MEDRPAVAVRSSYYHPSKAELEEDVDVDATPEVVRAARMRSVKLEKSDDA